MSSPGKARNARLNQAERHIQDLLLTITRLRGATRFERIDRTADQKDDWYEGRIALEKLTQCFHEANAYNNCVPQTKPESDPGSKPKE